MDPFAPGPRYPGPANPGDPPPPLPGREAVPAGQEWPSPFSYVDPLAIGGLAEMVPWRSRLHASSVHGWSPVTILRAIAPARHTPPPNVAYLDEQPLTLTGLRAPEAALPPAPPGTPLLSRLRILHERFLPQRGYLPLRAEWTRLAGMPAVLDHFSLQPGDVRMAFSIAAELEGGAGAVVVGAAPRDRHGALADVGLPLARRLGTTDDGLTWVLPHRWTWTEELQLVSERVIARVRLVPLPPGWELPEWTADVFARAPFLRDLRKLGDREVEVAGVADARLSRFDWQPSGQGRMLTSVVTGLAGNDGFSLVVETPFESGSEFHTTDPDAVLGMVRVEMDPASIRKATRTADVADRRPVELAEPGENVLRLLAQVDRTLVAAVDIVDGLLPLGRQEPLASNAELAEADVAAISAAVDGILGKAAPDLLLRRLAGWTAGMTGFDPAASNRTRLCPLLGHDAARVERLLPVVNFARADPGTLASRWAGMARAGDAAVTDAFWATAFMLAQIVTDPVESGDADSLVAVLHAASDRLPQHPRVGWQRDLAGSGPRRPPRYRLRTFLDAGSGVLAWSGNEVTRDRFDYPVEHHWLPISKALADTVEELLAQYDEGSGLLRGDAQTFGEEEWATFRRSYLAVVDELQWQLGSAYELVDESRLARS